MLLVGAPVLVGLLGVFFYNQALTGSGWRTPYQAYTDIYTPRHVYGFDNVVRGDARIDRMDVARRVKPGTVIDQTTYLCEDATRLS